MKHLWLILLLLGAVAPGLAQEKIVPASGETDFCGEGKKCVDLYSCAPPTEQLHVPAQVILVLGNSGSGKSTLTKFLTGIDEDMHSVNQQNDYVIQGERIGNDIQSFTKVPELMVDMATGAKFYDCPGFEDSRGSCTEVSTTYYMKDITRHAREVKVLLLTPHYATKRGEDRSEFVTMLMHAARILRETDKFKGSVALVVTKVRAFMKIGRVFGPIPEDLVRDGVVVYLRDQVLPFLDEKEGEADNAEEAEAVVSARAIVQSLVDNPALIGIFRAPDEEGPVNKIELMTEGRQVLRNMVYDTLRYAEVQPQDFGFSVSARTKLFAMERSRQLGDAVAGKLSALASHVVDAGATESYDPADIVGTVRRFDEKIAELERVAEDLKNSTSVQDFAGRLAEDMTGTPQQAMAVDAATDFHNLDVVQVVSDESLLGENAVAQWARTVGQAAEELGKHRNWNRLLVSMYGRLSQRDAQANRPHYLSRLTPPGAANVTDQNLHAFLDGALGLGLPVGAQPSKGANLTDLNLLLRRVLRRGLGHECLPDGRLVITGESVLLSEAMAKAQSSPCPGAVRQIEVYALNTVFVDEDVRLPGGSLVVAAPRWEVIGERRIALDGDAGAEWEGRMNVCCGMPGVNGKAGKPGAPGGSFLGIGLEFVGGDRLRVSVNGGRGGNGQPGGAGGDGKQGGGNGGRGGDGGVGGFGGRHGKAKTLSVDEFTRRTGVKLEGQDGPRGVAGTGGPGGDFRPFTRYYVGRRRKRAIGLIILGIMGVAAAVGGTVYAIKKANEPPPTAPPPVFHDGPRGANGVSTDGLMQPINPQPVHWHRVPAQLQTYLQHNLDHPYRRAELRHFLDLVDESDELKALRR